MTLVLGSLLANGEMVDHTGSMDKENTKENRLTSPREKKRRISAGTNDTTATHNSKENGDGETKPQNGHTDHHEHKKRPTNHTLDPQEKSSTAKPLRTSKSGSVCCIMPH